MTTPYPCRMSHVSRLGSRQVGTSDAAGTPSALDAYLAYLRNESRAGASFAYETALFQPLVPDVIDGIQLSVRAPQSHASSRMHTVISIIQSRVHTFRVACSHIAILLPFRRLLLAHPGHMHRHQQYVNMKAVQVDSGNTTAAI